GGPRLPPTQGAPTRRRWRTRDRRFLPRGLHRGTAQPAHLRGARRLHHLTRVRGRSRAPRAARTARTRPGSRHHHAGRPGTRPPVLRAHADHAAPGRGGRPGHRRDRLGPCRRGRPTSQRPTHPRGARRPARTYEPTCHPQGVAMTDVVKTADAYERPPDGVHPPLASPEYKSTQLRAPAKSPLVIPHTITEVTGPVLGERDFSSLDADLTRQHPGEPLGERIIVHGRVLDGDGRPLRNTLVEIWQANAEVGSASGGGRAD